MGPLILAPVATPISCCFCCWQKMTCAVVIVRKEERTPTTPGYGVWKNAILLTNFTHKFHAINIEIQGEIFHRKFKVTSQRNSNTRLLLLRFSENRKNTTYILLLKLNGWLPIWILNSIARFVSVDYFTDVMSRKIAIRVFSTETNIHFHVSIHHTKLSETVKVW